MNTMATREQIENGYTIGLGSAVDRVLGQVLQSSWKLTANGERPPSVAQIAAVMHALADYTHNQHMVGPAILPLGLGGAWPSDTDQAHALGRYFHGLGDRMDEMAWDAPADDAEAALARLEALL